MYDVCRILTRASKTANNFASNSTVEGGLVLLPGTLGQLRHLGTPWDKDDFNESRSSKGR